MKISLCTVHAVLVRGILLGCVAIASVSAGLSQTYEDCGGNCSNLAPGKTVTASGLWDAVGNPASKVNDTNTGTTSTCEGSSGYCAIASDYSGGQAIGT